MPRIRVPKEFQFRIVFRIDPKTQARFKRVLDRRGGTMQSVMYKIIQDWLKAEEQGATFPPAAVEHKTDKVLNSILAILERQERRESGQKQ
jgi:hypothetical protein